MPTSLKKTLEQQLGSGRVRENVSLAPYSTFKIGGPAEYFFQAETDEDIVHAAKAAHEAKIPLHIFGGISNVVIGPEGLKGLVVKNHVSYKEIIEDADEYVVIRVAAGYNMTRLSKETAADGYAGLEYQFGLPGSVGGAIYMNSKWTAHGDTRYSGDPLISARLVDKEGNEKTVDHDYFNFAYDYSILQKTKEILLSVDFKLIKDDPEKLIAAGQDALAYRKRTQPFGVATSGCFFQNVDGQSAGKIIDEVGLKGYTIGGAKVSEKHANFIENTGSATAQDVQNLVSFVKKKVKEERNIDLVEEVICL